MSFGRDSSSENSVLLVLCIATKLKVHKLATAHKLATRRFWYKRVKIGYDFFLNAFQTMKLNKLDIYRWMSIPESTVKKWQLTNYALGLSFMHRVVTTGWDIHYF